MEHGGAPAAITDSEREYHLREFDKLNVEIAELIRSTSQLFNFSIVASGAIFAWVLTSGDDKGFVEPLSSLKLGLWVPATLSLALAILAFAQGQPIRQMGSYLKEIEERFAHRPYLGWESFFETKSPVITGANILAWTTLLAGNLLIAWIGTFCV